MNHIYQSPFSTISAANVWGSKIKVMWASQMEATSQLKIHQYLLSCLPKETKRTPRLWIL